MEKFKCLIIDDEPQAIDLLRGHLHFLYENIEITGSCKTWNHALETLRSTDADIVFLDISLQNKNGMDLLRHVPDLKAEVIFITAYSDYALDAYKLTASGYIVKPIDETELIKTVDKTLERVKNKKNAAKIASVDLRTKDKIGIPNNNAIDYINTSDIYYFKANGSYTHVVAANSEFVSSFNIQRFKEILDETMFFQVHRSYIINVGHIKRYENTGIIVMDNNTEIPVSRNFRDSFLKIFNRVSNKN